ncbi:MotA/TolQ/ExbB proton channel family protein [Phytohalomonas tamaricis]|uniref:MotA/TolQ/ExbB proton channel family protein n=1 Tax=Phytohalomonas tamaricis TaxID=2081032 RepID=UPI000D0B2AD2|nr:MotA/TolQ/ExbB proton channel family protein [Phytohalomonas tamaricis]
MDALFDPVDRLITAGGPVLVAIALTAMLLFALSFERMIFWQFGYPKSRQALIERWIGRREHISWSARTLRESWCQELLLSLRAPLPWLKLLIAICPLLGLLGTVTGMIQVFDGLSLSGVGQARSLSDGVARATLPTLAGMAVAVVGLLFTSRYEHVIRREDQRLHDQLTRAAEDAHA